MDVMRTEAGNENLEEKIVEAARDLFVRKGFEQTSMSDIAQAAAINRTTLHYYFRTKERMFQAVFGSIVLSFLPRIQLIFDEDATFMEKLSKAMDEYFSIFTHNPFLPRFIISEIQRDVDHLLNVGRVLHLDQYLGAIGNVIEKEMERGAIKAMPLPEVMVSFMSSVTYPFLAKNLIIALFYDNETDFTERFLKQWKQRVLDQMEGLLFENKGNNRPLSH